MKKETILEMVHSAIDNVCTEAMKDKRFGDITPSQESKLDKLEKEIAELIFKVREQN